MPTRRLLALLPLLVACGASKASSATVEVAPAGRASKRISFRAFEVPVRDRDRPGSGHREWAHDFRPWARTTKGICVDWCQTNSDCTPGKTCMDSEHILVPEVGEIKTCQKAPTAGPGTKNVDDGF